MKKHVKGQREEKTEKHQLTGPCHGHKMKPFIRELRDTHYTLDPLPTALFHLSLPAPFGPLFCLLFFCCSLYSWPCLSKIARAPSQSQKEGFHAQHTIHTSRLSD